MDTMQTVIAIVCIGMTVAFMLIGVKANQEDNQVQERISELSRNENQKKHSSRQKQLESSFSERVIFPFAQMVFDRTQAVIPLTSKSWVKMKLIQAGYQKPHYQKVFLGIQLLCTVVLFGTMFSFTALFGQVGGMLGIIIGGFFCAAGYGLPLLWVIQQAGKSQESIPK